MLKLLFAEYQKISRTFTKRLVLLAPVVPLLLCGILGVGNFFQSGSYNWWYAMLLPGSFTLICAGVVQKDKKKLNYRAILSLPISPASMWTGKIGVCTFLYLISCIVFFTGVTLGGFILGSSITLIQSAAGSTLLFITFLWQIPLCMFLTDKFGTFFTVIVNTAGNILCLMLASRTSFWWIPYAIPSRLMCPVIHVLPNGLPVPPNDPLLSTSVILPGILITLILFFALSAILLIPYHKLEAK